VLCSAVTMLAHKSVRARLKFATVLWIFYGVSLLFVAGAVGDVLTTPEDRRGVSAASPGPDKEYVFAPDFSDYSVTFCQTPKVTEMRVEGGEGLKAQVSNSSIRSMLRAEVVRSAPRLPKSVTKEMAFAYLSKRAEEDGLVDPHFEWEETEIGPTASVRGAKTLVRGEDRIHLTYYSRVYYGPSSTFAVTVAGLAERYPTEAISAFLNSVRRK